jgi:hypothetical protein
MIEIIYYHGNILTKECFLYYTTLHWLDLQNYDNQLTTYHERNDETLFAWSNYQTRLSH